MSFPISYQVGSGEIIREEFTSKSAFFYRFFGYKDGDGLMMYFDGSDQRTMYGYMVFDANKKVLEIVGFHSAIDKEFITDNTPNKITFYKKTEQEAYLFDWLKRLINQSQDKDDYDRPLVYDDRIVFLTDGTCPASSDITTGTTMNTLASSIFHLNLSNHDYGVSNSENIDRPVRIGVVATFNGKTFNSFDELKAGLENLGLTVELNNKITSNTQKDELNEITLSITNQTDKPIHMSNFSMQILNNKYIFGVIRPTMIDRQDLDDNTHILDGFSSVSQDLDYKNLWILP